jgi:hypothetical protein
MAKLVAIGCSGKRLVGFIYMKEFIQLETESMGWLSGRGQKREDRVAKVQ